MKITKEKLKDVLLLLYYDLNSEDFNEEVDTIQFREEILENITDFNSGVKCFRSFYGRDPLDLQELTFFLVNKCEFKKFLDVIVESIYLIF